MKNLLPKPSSIIIWIAVLLLIGFNKLLGQDLITKDNYNENRMDTSICFISNNTNDVIENFHNYLELLKKCGLAERSVFEPQESKFNPCVTDVI